MKIYVATEGGSVYIHPMKQIIHSSKSIGFHAGYVLSGYRGIWYCLAIAAFGASIQLGWNSGRYSACVTIGRRVIGRSFQSICN